MKINSKPSPCDDFFEEARRAGITDTEALAGKKLSGYNLSGYDLSNLNLSGTILNGTDLSHSKMSGANLQNTQLRGADLTKAKLCGANLSDANLNGADLSGADLSGAILCRANFSNADLSGADLSGIDVRDTKFSENLGLPQSIQRKLKLQGADVGNSTNSINSGKELKWWLKVIIVPILIALIGSGVSIINALKSQSPKPMPTLNAEPTEQKEG